METTTLRRFTCPRRPSRTNVDQWRPGHAMQQQTLTCSYCGSLHPDTFMLWVHAGGELSPTDKNYKTYITQPQPRTWTTIRNLPNGEAKFYFQHLSSSQRTEFIGLLNDQQVNLAYPGYFYQLPFFIKKTGQDNP